MTIEMEHDRGFVIVSPGGKLSADPQRMILENMISDLEATIFSPHDRARINFDDFLNLFS